MKNSEGFTLMELMTVIAIVGILSAIAVPNMISWRSNHQLNSSAREILSFIRGGRLQAVKGNTLVTIHFNTGVPGEEIQSSQRNRSIEDDAAPDAWIRSSVALRPGITIARSGFGGDDEIVYNGRGLISDYIGGTLTLTNSRGKKLKVIVASTGIARISGI